MQIPFFSDTRLKEWAEGSFTHVAQIFSIYRVEYFGFFR